MTLKRRVRRPVAPIVAGIEGCDWAQVPIGRELKRLGVRPSRGIRRGLQEERT
jgi:hypothetical protein